MLFCTAYRSLYGKYKMESSTSSPNSGDVIKSLLNETKASILTPLDTTVLPRLNITNVTRSGIIDKITAMVTVPSTSSPTNATSESSTTGTAATSTTTFGICHIGTFIPFSYQNLELPVGQQHVHFSFETNSIGGVAAINLAIEMLNTGDGSIVNQIEGINERCPIKFTTENFDTGINQIHTINQLTTVLNNRNSTRSYHQRGEGNENEATQTRHEVDMMEQREVCAILGASRSSVTIPMAILTGIAGRPQLR